MAAPQPPAPTRRPSTRRATAPQRAGGRHRTLVVALAVAVVAAVLGGVEVGGVDVARLPEAGAQARTVTLDPPAAKAGEQVTVSWTGFSPGSPVSIFQCNDASPLRWRNCAEPTWVGGTTGPDGRGSARFTVWSLTFPGNGANEQLLCVPGFGDCRIVVTECDTELNTGTNTSVPIQVLPGGTNPGGDGGDGGEEGDGEVAGLQAEPVLPQAALQPGAPAAVAPASAPLAASTATRELKVYTGQAFVPVLDALTTEVATAAGVNLNSTSKNSPTANDVYARGNADVAFTTRPFSEEALGTIAAEDPGRRPVLVPIAVSPQAVIHNMDVRGVPIQRFRMSVDTAAKIWQSLIVGVGSPELRLDNGGCGITTSGPTNDRSILGYYRTDQSGANWTFSKWLTTAGQLPDGRPLWPPSITGAPPLPSPDELFPSADDSRGRSSNRDLSTFVQLGTLPGVAPPVNNVAGRLRIGFVDLAEAEHLIRTSPPDLSLGGRQPLRFVQLQNASGNWVLPTSDAVNATLAQSTIGADNVVDVNVRATGAAYPLVNVVYAALPPAPSERWTPEQADAARDVVEYLVSDRGQLFLAQRGFFPLSGALAERARTAVAGISTTPGTTTTTAPPTTAPPGGGTAGAVDDLDASVESLGGDFDAGFDSGDSGFDSDFGGGFDSDFGGDDLSGGGFDDGTGGFDDGTGGFAGEEGDLGAAGAEGGGEEAAAGEATAVNATLLGESAATPALLLVLVLGLVALVAGPVVRAVGVRRARRAAGP